MAASTAQLATGKTATTFSSHGRANFGSFCSTDQQQGSQEKRGHEQVCTPDTIVCQNRLNSGGER